MSFAVSTHRATPRLLGGGRFEFCLLKDECLEAGPELCVLLAREDRWEKRRRRAGRVRLLFLQLWGQQGGTGGAWMLPGKANL